MKPPKTRGFALALVLIMIVLAVTIATVFLASTARERRSVDLYGQESQVRNLSDMAVSRVMSQINAATKENTVAAPVAWASQPGMIRTYDQNGAKSIYKLYSWDKLFEPGTGFSPSATSEIPASTWKTSPALYTDLNAPANGVYPIVDPAGSGVVQGFSIDNTDPIVGASGGAPMPVKWLYVLEDGTTSAGTTSGQNVVTVAGASATNNIVGRIAFWTDDETAKVNVNTASEGEFWDWPKGGSYDEMQFAGNPPVRGEYQRIPGHPAMTSFSSVFPEIATATRWSGANASTTYTTEQSKVFPLTPRYEWGGSQGGTFPITSYTFAYGPTKVGLTNAPPLPAVKADRLYTEPQELLFTSNITASTPPARVPNTFSGINATAVTDDLRQREFFLTASSRAPETNLFGLPRVSLWPITWPNPSAYFKIRGGAPAAGDPTKDTTSNPWMTPQERLLAFCATLDKQGPSATTPTPEQRYYPQRQNPDSPTYDWLKIARNQQLFGSYLYTLTGKPVPGYGGTLTSRDTTLAKIFDYSRSCVNQYTPDPYKGAIGGAPQASLLYSYTGFSGHTVSTNNPEPQAFSVVPISTTIGGSKQQGLGAFPKLKEATLVFYATNRNPATYVGPPPPNDNRRDPRLWKNLMDMTSGISQTTEMKAVLLFDFINGATADIGQTPTFWIRVAKGSFNVNGTSMDLTGRTVQWSSFIGNDTPDYAGLYQRQKTAGTNQPTAAKTFDPTATGEDSWSLISPTVSVPTASFTFGSTSSLVLEFYGLKNNDPAAVPTAADTDLLISTCTIDFTPWNGTYPTPLSPAFCDWDCPSAKAIAAIIPAINFGGPWPAAVAGIPVVIPDPMFDDKVNPIGTYRWVGTEIAPQVSTDPAGTAPGHSAFILGTHRADESSTYLPTFGMDIQKRVMYGTTSLAPSYNYVPQSPLAAVQPFNTGGGSNAIIDLGNTIVTPYDTTISMVMDPNAGGGDPRMVEQQLLPTSFVRVDKLFPVGTIPRESIYRTIQGGAGAPGSKDGHNWPQAPRNNSQFHTLGSNFEPHFSTGYVFSQTMLAGVPMATSAVLTSGSAPFAGKLGNRQDSGSYVRPLSTVLAPNGAADWSAGGGSAPDGGAVVRADQDYQIFTADSYDYAETPYYPSHGLNVSPAVPIPGSVPARYVTGFSPNRQIPSPVILGCLPRGTSKGWQTLAFSPNPADIHHPGLASGNTAPDHLWLDLFWMPVAEPYPMSDQFTTAGKVNLNYQIAPFSYIKRQTGLYAAMKSTWLTAMPAAIAADFKSPWYMKTDFPGQNTRYTIDVAETLKDFDKKFKSGELFHSASQLCEMSLVPSKFTLANISTFWANNTLTSDTAREEPYDHLYSRVTTTSNTFTVHWRVQALHKVSGTPIGSWDEIRDKVVADKRGSTLIERYIDPNATAIPDYADPAVLGLPTTLPLSNYYKWRIASEHYFQPPY